MSGTFSPPKRAKRFLTPLPILLSTRPSQEEWETRRGREDTLSLAVLSAPITRPELQILKKNRIAPTSLLRNGEHALVLSEETSCDAACWRLSLALSPSAG